MKTFWYKSKNFGDNLTAILVRKILNEKIELADRNDKGKLLAVGSILTAMRENDVIWGTGSIRDAEIKIPNGVKILALRGPLTRRILRGENIPQIYGDPGLLLPLIYNPKIKKIHKIGIVPHYVDKEIRIENGMHFINIESEPKKIIQEILSCELIISSSLHGIVCAEAYGIPAIWAKYSNKIIGGDFKFQDYFLGTGRGIQKKNVIIEPIKNLAWRQGRLIGALELMILDIKKVLKLVICIIC